jgi:transcription termination factor Rho
MTHPLTPLLELSTAELLAQAEKLGIPAQPAAWRDGLLAAIAERRSGEEHGCGVLEVHEEGFGFLRSPLDGLLPGQADIYVSQSQIKRFNLRTGDTVIGRIRPPKEQERYAALLRVEVVDGEGPDVHYTPFEQVPAVHPSTRLPLARDPWLAAVDWVAPLGLGARGLLVAPPRPERSELLRRLAAVFAGDERVQVMVLLAGERPEDVTEWREATDAEVVATPMDEQPSRHLQVADIVFERARRLAERGAEVLLLVDSFTRLLRLALADGHGSGHLVEGVDGGALLRLRRWFGTGRDLRGAGSVTLVGAVDADPGDALSGVLRRDLGDVATWQVTLRTGPGAIRSRPDLDVARSWTLREDLLVVGDELERRRRWRAETAGDPRRESDALADLFRPAALDAGS